MFQVPYFLMTYEEIFSYKENLLPRAIKKEIYFVNRYDDPKFMDIKTIRVLERNKKSNILKLIAILVDITNLQQREEDKLKDDGKIEQIEEKNNLFPSDFQPFYPEDVIENVERAIKMRKL